MSDREAKEWTGELFPYRWKPSGELHRIDFTKGKDGEITAEIDTCVSNFTPILLERKEVDDGYEIVEEMRFIALRNGRRETPIDLSKKDILAQNPDIKFSGACRINIGKHNKAFIREFMQQQAEHIEPKRIYHCLGWRVIDNKRVYLNGARSITAQGLTEGFDVIPISDKADNYMFESETINDWANGLFSLFSVTKEDLAFTGLALVFLSPLNNLFRELGIEPRFITYFIGKTGAGKSEMSYLLLDFFRRHEQRAPLSFRDTPNAIEATMSKADSTLLLIDDRFPAPTSIQRAQMEAVEQTIARQIGDRSARGRLNADGSLQKSYTAKCNLLATSEEYFSNIGSSAIARSIAVELKPGDVNFDKLTEAQNLASARNYCMALYLQWVIKQWENIKAEAKCTFERLRAEAQKGYHGRMAETVAHLSIGIKYMCLFLQDKNIISRQQADTMKTKAWDIFLKLAAEQNKRITEESPIKLFINTLKEEIELKNVHFVKIAKDKNNRTKIEETPQRNTIGYTDGIFYYCLKDTTYSVIYDRFKTMGKTFPVSDKTLWKYLKTEKFADPSFQKWIRGKNDRYLRLEIAAVEKGGAE